MLQPIKVEDLACYRFLSGLRLSEDGRRAVFAVRQSNRGRDGYDTDLWWCAPDGAGSGRLTSSGDAGPFCWLDPGTVLFASKRGRKTEKEREDGATDFYRLPLGGGEAEPFFAVPAPVSRIEALGGGRYAVEAAFDNRYPGLSSPDAAEREAERERRRADDDYIVAEELPFWSNGEGVVDRIRNRLYLFDAASGAFTPLTPPLYRVEGWNVASGGGKIVCFGAEFDTIAPDTHDLRIYDTAAGACETLVGGGRYRIDHAEFMGGEVLFLGSDCARYGCNENGIFYVVDADGRIVQLYGEDFSFGSSVGSDCRSGGGTVCKLNGDALLFIETDRACSRLCRMTSDGREWLTRAEGSVDCFDAREGACVFVAMRGMDLQEVYALGPDGTETRLTRLNEGALAGRNVSAPRRLPFTDRDGVEIDGWVIEPMNYDPQKKYPAILDIHGGPKTVYGTVFFHEMQVWSGAGYFVLFCNPRGGDGRGNAFADIRGKYGREDYRDIMEFTDRALEAYPAIDPARLGVTGGSYGGFMTNWIIGHTDRFAAAASQRSIANWISMEGVSDIGPLFVPDQTAGDLQENVGKEWEHSPLRRAGRCKTPTLFIHSREDYRCPECEGIQMFSALRRRGVPARLVLFKGENHELSRSGVPKHRFRRLEEITGWFDRYLK